MKKLMALATTAAALAMSAPANAVLLDFSLSGFTDSGEVESATFTLDSNVIPDYYSDGVGFAIYDVPGAYQWGDYTSTINDLVFYSDALDGGFFSGDYLITTSGPQLYTGPESAPTFLTGTFDLTDYFLGGSLTLTITPESVTPPPAVPEPASWALMLSGFGLVGGALRSRKRTTVSFG